MALEIVEPGLLTTVQDRGRFGHQRFGVPVSGALDTFALRAANLLAGNDDGDAGLEMTVLGPRVRFGADTWFAIAGADLTPMLDGQPISNWRRVRAPAGSVLSFQGSRDGMRAYLAIAGGIDVPRLMGSRSTYLKGEFGGLEGRPLRAGDALETLGGPREDEFDDVELPGSFALPEYGHDHRIRVVLGPQNGAFTEAGVETLLGSEYKVSVQSDRMGYRLDGPVIEHVSGPDIVSDGTSLGAVQVPGNGLPIVLLADRGTTGGYAKIATVVSVDIGRIAQAMPGDAVRFEEVSVEEAHAIFAQQEATLRDLAEAAGVGPARGLSVMIDGETFEISDEFGAPVSLPAGLAEGPVWSHSARAASGGAAYEFDIRVGEARTEQ